MSVLGYKTRTLDNEAAPVKRPACSGAQGGQCNEEFETYVLEMTPEVLGRPKFISKLKKYIATTVPGQNVEIVLSNRKSSKQEDDLHFAYKFYCKSCASCMSFKRGWRGSGNLWCHIQTVLCQSGACVLSRQTFDRRMGVFWSWFDGAKWCLVAIRFGWVCWCLRRVESLGFGRVEKLSGMLLCMCGCSVCLWADDALIALNFCKRWQMCLVASVVPKM